MKRENPTSITLEAKTILLITSNGSHCAGSGPSTLAELLDTLATQTLDPTFEKYGDFASFNPCRAVRNPDYRGYGSSAPEWIDGPPLYPNNPGTWRFFGNFHGWSHVFNIDTDDETIIAQLRAAIAANKATPAYEAAAIARGLRKVAA
jgi:hypothetical protein